MIMSDTLIELISATINRVNTLIDYDIYNDFHKRHEFKKQTVFADKLLTEDVKTEVMRRFNKAYDRNKVMMNEGAKKICENCNQECLATLYCGTSGNNDIDNLIQKCQEETLIPENIIEWIPYN